MPVGRKPTEAELELIRRHAPDADPDMMLVYRHLMVGDQIVPRRFLRLHPTETLPKFQADTAAGAPWIFDHNYWNPVTFGRAFAGELVKEPENCTVERDGKLVPATVEATHLYGMYYMPKDVELPTAAPYPSTTKMAQAIDMGLSRDTSIGFGIDRYECSICKNDIRDWDNCMHWPGQVYDVGENKRQMCIVDCKGGQLIEQSSVFRGAYPIAGIQKQSAAADVPPMTPVGDADVKLLPVDAQAFHTFSVSAGMQTFVPDGTALRTRESFDATGGKSDKMGAGPDAGDGKQGTEIEGQSTPERDNAWATIVELGGRKIGLVVSAEALANLPESIDLACAIPVAGVSDAQARIDEAQAACEAAETAAQGAQDRATAAEARATVAEQALSAQQDRLRTALTIAPDQDPVAWVEAHARDLADTVTYRKHLIEESVAMGVRAYGNAFDAEGWTRFLSEEDRPLTELQAQLTKFEAEARTRIPGVRLSVAPPVPGSQAPSPPPVPDSVYRTRRSR